MTFSFFRMPAGKLRQAVRTHAEKFSSEKFVESHISSYRTLLVFRGCSALWCLFILVLSWIRSRNAGSFLFFLTNLSWISVTAYFAIATWIGWLAHVHDNNHDLVTSKVKPALRFILYNLYITQITFQFIVVAVFWTFLTGTMMKTPTPLSWFVNLNVHGLGLLLLLIDFSLNRIPLYYSQWVAPAVAALLYIGYAWVQHFAVGDDFWIYSFLDTRNRYWYLWYLSLFFIMLAIFCALVAASKWRDRVAKARAREFEERVSLNESV